MQFGGVMMALGVFRFDMSNGAYQKMARSAGHRWTEVNRIGREAALQYLGQRAQQITIEGVIYVHFKGGLRQVELMRAQAALKMLLMMVDRLGGV
ncbi:phage tail protein [Ruegeria sp. 6PALISEP08]|uniref:phage tail protein n=1 Tax=Ruegeria sp. 6PALISEP08 TaxID=1225660 RepID=UPI000B0789CE|nr:phage tail protein [Ruegeria sp. 6PALISEP08]